MMTTHAPVLWAQRNDKIFLTICVDDCKNPTINVDAGKLHFKGVGGAEKREYECDLELHAEINPETSRYAVRDRQIEFVLMKKDTSGPYWPRLLKDSRKVHWLKVDFAKWKDEDESDNENDYDLNDMMRNMGGLDGGDSNFGNMMGNDISDDSDDEELPDLESTPAPGEGEEEEGEGEDKGMSDVAGEGVKESEAPPADPATQPQGEAAVNA